MHVITGEIRKDVYTKEGNGAKGPWKMYGVDLTERYKDRDGNTQYTNYRATFFASEKQIPYYNDWIKKGQIISVTCETLAITSREGSNGTTYITAEMNNPQLAFFQSAPAGGSNGGGQQQPQQRQQPQQQQQQQQQRQQHQSQNAPMDFDDDIPFAPIGLQYGKSKVYAL